MKDGQSVLTIVGAYALLRFPLAGRLQVTVAYQSEAALVR